MSETTARHRAAPGVLLHGAAVYDAFVWVLTLGRERRLRERMLALARLAPNESVLDVGCGTGTLAMLAKERLGASGVVFGVDASPEMIARARRKARKGGVEVGFEVAPAQALPFPEARFDLALSTLMLHHLGRPARAECLAEIRRVLKPKGRVLVVDFEASAPRRGLLARLRHRHAHVAAVDVDRLLRDAGFAIIESGAVGFRDLHFSLAARSE